MKLTDVLKSLQLGWARSRRSLLYIQGYPPTLALETQLLPPNAVRRTPYKTQIEVLTALILLDILVLIDTDLTQRTLKAGRGPPQRRGRGTRKSRMGARGPQNNQLTNN